MKNESNEHMFTFEFRYLQFHKNDSHPQYWPICEGKRLFSLLNFWFANTHKLRKHKPQPSI